MSDDTGIWGQLTYQTRLDITPPYKRTAIDDANMRGKPDMHKVSMYQLV
jgi:hypothetical protein